MLTCCYGRRNLSSRVSRRQRTRSGESCARGVALRIEHVLVQIGMRLDLLLEEGDEVGDDREAGGLVDARKQAGTREELIGPGQELLVHRRERSLDSHDGSLTRVAGRVHRRVPETQSG